MANWYTLNIAGERIQCTDENTHIFVFPGRLSKYDHIYLHGDDRGVYVFGRRDLVKMFSESRRYPMTYLPFVPEADQQAWEKYHASTTLSEEDIKNFSDEIADGVNWDELD